MDNKALADFIRLELSKVTGAINKLGKSSETQAASIPQILIDGVINSIFRMETNTVSPGSICVALL
jgi:hypothetical protein